MDGLVHMAMFVPLFLCGLAALLATMYFLERSLDLDDAPDAGLVGDPPRTLIPEPYVGLAPLTQVVSGDEGAPAPPSAA